MMTQKIRRLIEEHVARRPEAHAQDIFKLLYQGVFGVGHIISDKAWDILVEEADRINLEEHEEEPLLEPCSPDGKMVRVNLRQYINAGGDLEKLFQAMKRSEIKGDPEVFLGYWEEFKQLVSEGAFNFPTVEIDALDDFISKNGPEPRHHSEPYREAYYPAYRVVSRQIFEAITGLGG